MGGIGLAPAQKLFLHEQLAAGIARGQSRHGGSHRLEHAFASNAARRHRPVVRHLWPVEFSRLAWPGGAAHCFPTARRGDADAGAADVRRVLPRHGAAASDADVVGWRVGTLSRGTYKLFRLRPGARAAVQHRSHMASATGDFLGRHLISGGGYFSRADDHGTRTARPRHAFLLIAGRAGGGGVWQHGRRVCGRLRLDPKRLVVVRPSGFHLSRSGPFLANSADGGLVLLGRDSFPWIAEQIAD